MTPKQAEVVQATANAQAARERLTGSTTALQARLKPETLKREMRQSLVVARTRAEKTALLHPLRVAGAVAATMLFFARKPILRLFRRKPRATATPTASYPSNDS